MYTISYLATYIGAVNKLYVDQYLGTKAEHIE